MSPSGPHTIMSTRVSAFLSDFIKVTLFGSYLVESLESNGRIPLASFLNLGPTPCWVRQRLDRNKAHSQSSKGTVQVVVFGSGFVFAHAVVPNPVIAYLAAAPVTTCELGEGFCTAFFRSKRADVEGFLGDFFGLCSAGASDDRQTACSG